MRQVLFLFLSISTLVLAAQPGSQRISRSEYIEMYKDAAIEEMHKSGVPASITLAQGILESGDGNSPLARYANNHFGIKCHAGWTGKTFIQDDDAKDECFRSYKSASESFHDHSEFLKKNRYAFLFELKPTDYKGWAKGLKKAGYATNPKYPQLLIDLIEKNELHRYDLEKPGRNKNKKINQQALANNRSIRKGSHVVKKHRNNIRYVQVKPDDTFEKIAEEFEMGEWQLYKYNDLNRGEELFETGILYLQPKRRKAKEEYHTVKTGETMWDISQEHGIKLKKLYRRNRMDEKEKPKVGQQLYLRKNKRR